MRIYVGNALVDVLPQGYEPVVDRDAHHDQDQQDASNNEQDHYVNLFLPDYALT